MRTNLTSLFAVALTTLTAPATAQEISDPGCAAIEEWVAPLSTARGRMGGTAHMERGKLVDQIFTDATTEALFGLANSRWQQRGHSALASVFCL